MTNGRSRVLKSVAAGSAERRVSGILLIGVMGYMQGVRGYLNLVKVPAGLEVFMLWFPCGAVTFNHGSIGPMDET